LASGNLAGSQSARWLALGAGATISALLWWQHFQRDPYSAETVKAIGLTEASSDRFLFVANPLAFMLLANAADIRVLDQSFQIVPAALAVVYLSAGWLRRCGPQLITGFSARGARHGISWSRRAIAIGWTALALLALGPSVEAEGREGATRRWRLGRRRGYASSRSRSTIANITGRARCSSIPGHWRSTPSSQGAASPRTGGARKDDLPGSCGPLRSAAFSGGSIQVQSNFGRLTPLAGDLALSVWWLLFAGASCSWDSALNHKLIRSIGLSVAALAGLKIVLYDLANLEALYRVGILLCVGDDRACRRLCL